MPITSMSSQELENLIRRVIREELIRLLHTPVRSILEDPRHEGQGDDPAGDRTLLRDALEILQKYDDKPDAWIKWEDFETELERAEAAGELPY